MLKLIDGKNRVSLMNSPNERHFCLLAHNVVNRLSAIVGHCEILDADAHGDRECLERLHKIRDLAASAAAMLQTQECEIEAVNRILELESTYVAPDGRKVSTSDDSEQECARQSSRSEDDR